MQGHAVRPLSRPTSISSMVCRGTVRRPGRIGGLRERDPGRRKRRERALFLRRLEQPEQARIIRAGVQAYYASRRREHDHRHRRGQIAGRQVLAAIAAAKKKDMWTRPSSSNWPGSGRPFNMCETDIESIMRRTGWPRGATVSCPSRRQPAHRGSYATFLYKIRSTPSGVRPSRSPTRSARRRRPGRDHELARRGRIAEGAAADIVVLDLRGSPCRPRSRSHQFSRGVPRSSSTASRLRWRSLHRSARGAGARALRAGRAISWRGRERDSNSLGRTCNSGSPATAGRPPRGAARWPPFLLRDLQFGYASTEISVAGICGVRRLEQEVRHERVGIEDLDPRMAGFGESVGERLRRSRSGAVEAGEDGPDVPGWARASPTNFRMKLRSPRSRFPLDAPPDCGRPAVDPLGRNPRRRGFLVASDSMVV